MGMSRYKRLLFALSLLTVLSACNRDPHDHPELTSGKQLFQHHCANCHGEAGMGTFLKGVPATIATRKTQTEIVLYLQQGPHTFNRKMPIFTNMPDKEAFKIARHLLELRRSYYNVPANRDKFLLERQSNKKQ